MSENKIHIFDITIDENTIEQQSLELLQTVRPSWPQEQIKFIVFTDGITNKLIGARLDSDTEKKDVVLVRIYGKGSDLMIDREIEMQNMLILNAAGCAKQLYGKFKNGILYGYVPGKCLDAVSVRDPKITILIVKEMVKMMAIDPDKLNLPEAAQTIKISKQPFLFTKSWKFLELVPDKFPNPEQDARRNKLIMSKEMLTQELKELEQVLSGLDWPVVFSHNDLLLNNIVYDEQSSSVSFIDYEYGAFNYLPFDLGNHFCEYAGVDTVDYDLYPDKEYQLQWLRQFLEVKAEFEGKDTGDITDEQVYRLYADTNKFALMAHFFWGMWGIIQARHSTIDFDYLEYSAIRLNEYLRRKEAFLAL